MQTYLDSLLAAMLEENKRLATCVTTMKSLVDEAKIDCQINNPENSDNMKHSTEQNPEAHRLAEKLRDAINRMDYGFSDAIATNDLRLAAMELESLHARVQELEAKEAKPAAPLNVWQQAIDAELVSAHLGVAPNDATFEGAQKAIHELICWHIDVATNPATNGGQRLTDAKPTTGELVMDVRCEGCGYMTHHREHMGCVRAAKQHTHAAPSAAQAAKENK